MMSASQLSGTLQDDLRAAVAAELTTLPAYLYTYWTIKPAKYGGSIAAEQARTTIMSVILEEMLHMALSSNIRNALGGTPNFTSAPFVPSYPCHLLRSPHRDPQGWGGVVELRRLSMQSIDNLMAIELPEWNDPDGPTLGKFYNDVVAPELPPDGPQWDHGRQLPEWNNPGAGRLFSISGQADALAAIAEIVDQGEGMDPKTHNDDDHELATLLEI